MICPKTGDVCPTECPYYNECAVLYQDEREPPQHDGDEAPPMKVTT